MALVSKSTLETPRLLLRPMQAADVDPLLHIFADPLVMAAFDTEPFNREQMERWVQRNLDHQIQYGYGLFAVILKSTGELIGDCGLEHMEVESLPAEELGYDFRRDHWNRGYATEAAMAVRDYAFQQLQLPKLISLIRVGNQSSRRVAEKIGMRYLAELTRYSVRYWHYALEREAVEPR